MGRPNRQSKVKAQSKILQLSQRRTHNNAEDRLSKLKGSCQGIIEPESLGLCYDDSELVGKSIKKLQEKLAAQNKQVNGLLVQDSSLKLEDFDTRQIFEEASFTKGEVNKLSQIGKEGVYKFTTDDVKRVHLPEYWDKCNETSNEEVKLNEEDEDELIGQLKSKFNKVSLEENVYVTQYDGQGSHEPSADGIPTRQIAAINRYLNMHLISCFLTRICVLSKFNLPGISSIMYLIGGAKTYSAIHIEDLKLASINFLLAGLKLWIIVDPKYNKALEDALKEVYEESLTKIAEGVNKSEPDIEVCGGIARHKMFVITPKFLDSRGIKYYFILQKPMQMVYTAPGVYHGVLNLKPSIAMAKNVCFSFRDDLTRIDEYEPCCKENTPVFYEIAIALKNCIKKYLKNLDALSSSRDLLTMKASNAPSTSMTTQVTQLSSSLSQSALWQPTVSLTNALLTSTQSSSYQLSMSLAQRKTSSVDQPALSASVPQLSIATSEGEFKSSTSSTTSMDQSPSSNSLTFLQSSLSSAQSFPKTQMRGNTITSNENEEVTNDEENMDIGENGAMCKKCNAWLKCKICKPEQFKCPLNLCVYSCDRKDNLKRHMKSTHNNEKKRK